MNIQTFGQHLSDLLIFKNKTKQNKKLINFDVILWQKPNIQILIIVFWRPSCNFWILRFNFLIFIFFCSVFLSLWQKPNFSCLFVSVHLFCVYAISSSLPPSKATFMFNFVSFLIIFLSTKVSVYFWKWFKSTAKLEF